jgi:D-alanyl-D-alanine dipeptidase
MTDDAPGISLSSPTVTILLSDPRVSAVPVHDHEEPLTLVRRDLAPSGQLVRASLARRLEQADAELPLGIRLRVVEGHRSPASQRAIEAAYSAEVRALHGNLPHEELRRLTSRFVAPIDVAPHVAGAAVDLTLVDVCGDELDMGTPIDATPEQSDGRCYFAAQGIGADARAHRDLLARVLTRAGLVNYPTEWWHWSYGDRYWALTTGAPAALYGPIERTVAA